MKKIEIMSNKYYLYPENETKEEILEYLKNECEKYLNKTVKVENINKETVIVSIDEEVVFQNETVAFEKIESKLRQIIEKNPTRIGIHHLDNQLFIYSEVESLKINFEYKEKFQKMKTKIENRTKDERLKKYYENTYYSTLFNDYNLIQNIVSIEIFNKIMKYVNEHIFQFDKSPKNESLINKFTPVIDKLFDKNIQEILNIKEINKDKIIIELCDETVCMRIERLKNENLTYK